MMALTRSREWLHGEMRDHDQSQEEMHVMPRRGDALHQPTSSGNRTRRDYWSFSMTKQLERDHTATLEERAAGINESEGRPRN